MYSEINSIANPLLPNLGQSQLGTDDGAGFGWEDMDVSKIGVAIKPATIATSISRIFDLLTIFSSSIS